MVVGHIREQVVSHMRVCNVVEEIVQEAVGAVHSCKGAPEPVPLLIIVMGQLGVGVLQQGDGHQPVVDDQVWNDVHLHVSLLFGPVPGKLLTSLQEGECMQKPRRR